MAGERKVSDPLSLHGDVAIVTGGGGGIGRGAVLAMARRSADIAVFDVDLEAAQQAAAEARAIGVRAIAQRCDVSNSADVRSAVEATVKELGEISIVFNNAGIQLHRSLEATEEEDWERLFDINVKGVYLVSRAVIPSMERRGGGVILNAGSVGAYRPLLGTDTAYVASKGAIVAMTRDMALALMKKNIRVLAICPGPVRTAILEESMRRGVVTEESVTALQLTDHIATPGEIGDFAAMLVSKMGRYIVGTGAQIDGGMSIV
jgi:NAD(P)-dependent dehydrogenase (short-subunit alcohol dehydrogenase family)